MNNDYSSDVDRDFMKPEIPSTLNVLTILSLIWSFILIVLGIWGYFNAEKQYLERDKMLEQMNSPDMPAFAKSMMGTPEEYIDMVTKSYENRIPMMIIGLVAALICIYGLIQMRKLKKEGFIFYVVGELLPVLAPTLFIGFHMLKSPLVIFMLAIAILFILLYSFQRKHLIY